MKATVVRTGQHSGGSLFIEVAETPSSPRYAVPVNSELPVGTVVDIVVTVTEVPKAPETTLEGADVSVANSPLLVVEEPVPEKTKKGGK